MDVDFDIFGDGPLRNSSRTKVSPAEPTRADSSSSVAAVSNSELVALQQDNERLQQEIKSLHETLERQKQASVTASHITERACEWRFPLPDVAQSRLFLAVLHA